MTGVDTNLLIALAAVGHPHHGRAVEAFEHELKAGERMALSASVAAEFLHAITDPRRFTPALEMRSALVWLEAWTAAVERRLA